MPPDVNRYEDSRYNSEDIVKIASRFIGRDDHEVFFCYVFKYEKYCYRSSLLSYWLSLGKCDSKTWCGVTI